MFPKRTKVDEELLERVGFKNFKSKNIEDANEFVLVGNEFHFALDRLIDASHEPVEHARIDELGDSVAHIRRLENGKRNGHGCLATNDHGAGHDRVLQIGRLHLQQGSRLLKRVLVSHFARAIPCGYKLDVAQMQNSGHKLEQIVDFCTRGGGMVENQISERFS